MNKLSASYFRDFVFKQKCIPWRVTKFLKRGGIEQWKGRIIYFVYRPFRYVPLFFSAIKENPVRAFRFYGKLNRNEIQKESYILLIYGPKILRDTLKICKSIGLKPFLYAGTLRGFILWSDFLPHSQDIDLGLLDEDFQKKDSIKKLMAKKGYKLTEYDDEYGCIFEHPKFHSLLMDFSRIYKENGCFADSGYISEKIFRTNYFPLDIFLNFKNVTFHRVSALIPSEFTRYLLLNYGERFKDIRKKSKEIYNDDIVKFKII